MSTRDIYYQVPMGIVVPSGMQYAFGAFWHEIFEPWQIELKLFIDPDQAPKSLEKHTHFIRASQILFGNPKSKHQFVWHPWAVDMIIAACSYKRVGLCGAGSCGKSEFMGLWAVLNWLAAPQRTLCYVTSTTIKAARDKVWGSISKYYNALPPSVLSIGAQVNTPTPSIYSEIGGRRLEKVGIHLVAAANGQSHEAIQKLRGNKAASTSEDTSRPNGRLIFIADELSDLSHAILALANNLRTNPYFHMIAAANPHSKFDPFSLFVEPKEGWDSISVDSPSWMTKSGGICLHFDNTQNPNYIARKTIWPIDTYENIKESLEIEDHNSPKFWRDFRGFWCPLGSDAYVYTAEDIKEAGAEETFTKWFPKPRIRLAGFDPAFTHGGDRAILWIGELGLAEDSITQIIQLVHKIQVEINAATKDKTRTRQIAEKVLEACKKFGVTPKNLGVDVSGAGGGVADMICELWDTTDVTRVEFGGKPSDLPISDLDKTPAVDRYDRRVTELSFFGKELLKHKQVYGITKELAAELTIREYTTTRAKGLSQVKIETKEAMRARNLPSPDISDAFHILLDTGRQRHGLVAKRSRLSNKLTTRGGWIELCKKKQVNPRATHRIQYN